MVAPDKDEDVTVDLATTIILKPGNVNDQSVGYASGIAGEVVNGSMTLPNGITIVAFYPAPAPYNSQCTQRFSAQDNHDNQQKPRSCCD